MALSSVTIALTPTFNAATALISLLDGSDFIAQGVALANVVGECVVGYPDGTTQRYGDISGTPLWTYATSLTSDPAVPINLYKDANGLFMKGTYSFKVTVLDTSTGATITQTLSFDYCATAPVPNVQLNFSCLTSPLVQATDLTPYSPPNETPWTITSRTITLYGPQGTSWVTGSSTQGILNTSTNSAWTGAYEAKLVVSITRTVSGVTEVYSMTETFKGDFECLSACEVACLLNIAHARTLTSRAFDKNRFEEDYQYAVIRAEHIAQALDCGDNDKIPALIAEIKSRLNVTDNCDCCGENQPTYITPLAGGGANLTLTGGSYMTITGSSPNYTVEVDSTGTDILNNTYNTVPAAGARMTVTGPVVTAGNPPIHTYTLTPDVQEPDIYTAVITADFNGTGMPTYSISSESNYGSEFKAFSGWTKSNVGGSTADPANVEFSSFLTSAVGSDPWTVSVETISGVLSRRYAFTLPKARVYYTDHAAFTHNFRVLWEGVWSSTLSTDSIRAAGITELSFRVTLIIKR